MRILRRWVCATPTSKDTLLSHCISFGFGGGPPHKARIRFRQDAYPLALGSPRHHHMSQGYDFYKMRILTRWGRNAPTSKDTIFPQCVSSGIGGAPPPKQ